MHYVLYAYQVLFTSIVIFNKIKKSIPHALSHPPHLKNVTILLKACHA